MARALWSSLTTYAKGDIVWFPGGVKASQALTLSGVVAGDTLTICDGFKFTCVASGATGYWQFNKGATDNDTATNLAAAINAAPTVSGLVTAVATASPARVTLTANTQGTADSGVNAQGNLITTSQTGTHITGTGTFTGGVNQANWVSQVNSNLNHQPPAVGTYNAYWAQQFIEEGFSPLPPAAEMQPVIALPGQTLSRENIVTSPNHQMTQWRPGGTWLAYYAPTSDGAIMPPVMAAGGSANGYSPGVDSVWKTRLVFRIVRSSWLVGLMQRANKAMVTHNLGVGE